MAAAAELQHARCMQPAEFDTLRIALLRSISTTASDPECLAQVIPPLPSPTHHSNAHELPQTSLLTATERSSHKDCQRIRCDLWWLVVPVVCHRQSFLPRVLCCIPGNCGGWWVVGGMCQYGRLLLHSPDGQVCVSHAGAQALCSHHPQPSWGPAHNRVGGRVVWRCGRTRARVTDMLYPSTHLQYGLVEIVSSQAVWGI
jgi:hypothetical protein